MKNPFKVGAVVKGEYFCNRTKEIATLLGYIESAQNVFIYSPRRYGKTSLIKVVLDEASRRFGAISIYVDIQKATSLAKFVETYSAAISEAFLTRKEKFEKIAEIFKRLVPGFEFDENGKIRMSFDFAKTQKGTSKAEDEVYNLPQKLADDYKKRVVVVFDEFQEIASFNGKSFEKRLRSYIQHHSDVCYIFMGSKTHIIMDMFSDSERAFYKSAVVFPLHEIPEQEMTVFILNRFRASGKEISEELAKNIIDFSHNIPYYIQMLGSYIWIHAGDAVKQDDIKEGIEDILENQGELFFSWFDSLSMHQRATLKALTVVAGVFSGDVIQEHGLGSPASVQSSVKSLVRNGLILKESGSYVVADPFFEMWLRRM